MTIQCPLPYGWGRTEAPQRKKAVSSSAQQVSGSWYQSLEGADRADRYLQVPRLLQDLESRLRHHQSPEGRGHYHPLLVQLYPVQQRMDSGHGCREVPTDRDEPPFSFYLSPGAQTLFQAQDLDLSSHFTHAITSHTQCLLMSSQNQGNCERLVAAAQFDSQEHQSYIQVICFRARAGTEIQSKSLLSWPSMLSGL